MNITFKNDILTIWYLFDDEPTELKFIKNNGEIEFFIDGRYMYNLFFYGWKKFVATDPNVPKQFRKKILNLMEVKE